MILRTGKRGWKILWGIPLVLVLFLATTLLLVPRWVNRESVRQKLTQIFQDRMGIRITFEDMDLSYLPVPRLSVREVSLVVPGGGQGRAASITLYPRLLQFLRGKAQISKLEIHAARFRLVIPKGQGEVQAGEPLGLLLAALARGEPDLQIVLQEGNLEVEQEGSPTMHFHDLNAEMLLPPLGFAFRISCSSNLWEEAVFYGRLDPQALRGEGRLDLKGLQLGPLMDSFPPFSGYRVSESSLNMEVLFSPVGPQGANADIHGTFHDKTIVTA
jgi:hypothetical protein